MPIGQIEHIAIDKLRPNPKNVRTHPKKQIALLSRAIEQFEFVTPVVADENLVILAGHARVEAAKASGLKSVPVIVLSGLSEAKRRAYMLADNKIAEMAGTDRQAAALEIGELRPLLEAEGLSIDLTGFAPAEIDSLFDDHAEPEIDPIDGLSQCAQKPVTQVGDLWLMGPHRLICGDARKGADFDALLLNDRAAMVLTDPPYNVRISGIQGRGKIKHREFAEASGEMSRAEFTAFLTEVLSLTASHSVDGSIHYVCMDWRHMVELQTAGEQAYSELKNLVVWNKTNAGQGSFYRSQHELIFVFKNGTAAHLNTFELGQHGRSRSNVWTYPGANTFRTGRMKDLVMHPTVKPVALVADAMRDCSRRGDVVLDPFMGSGTTIMAAERVGRRGYGIELDPLYVDVAVRRWQAFIRRDAVLSNDGRTFDEISEERASGQVTKP